MNLWIDVAVMASAYAVGVILFGHFEERTPKWRRVLKFFMFTGVIVLISATAGRAWSIGFVAALLSLVAVVHAWWLPRQGIHPLTAEPKDKYYALRAWKL
jgi:Mn2+/Fe2+ NRAMP family transporter